MPERLPQTADEPSSPFASLADRERTFWLGVVVMGVGFLAAELLHSLTWAPLALVVPGGILTLLGTLALLGGDDR